MILFHVSSGYVKQVLSQSGLTSTVRGDNLIDGTPYTTMPYLTGIATGLLGDVVGAKAKIVGGTGIGQMRSIVSNSTNSLTVDAPWRVAPDSTSKLVIDPGYNNNIIYNNDFTGAPPGFVPPGDAITASNMVQLDGNSWHNVVEGNTAQRLEVGGAVMASYATQSYWNEFRGNIVTSRNWGTIMSYYEYGLECGAPAHGPGPALVGNAIRDSVVTVTGPIRTHNQYAKPVALGDHVLNHWACYPALTVDVGRGNIYENVRVSGVERSLKAGSYSNSLFRNNIVSVAPSPSVDWNIIQPDEVVLARAHARPAFTGNTYPHASGGNGATALYAAEESADVPRLVLPYRVLRLRGPQGSTLAGNIPVYNVGIKTSSWSASAPAWLGVTAANRTLSAESTIGRLTVAVNTSGLTRGTHVGKIRVAMGRAAQIATVRLVVE